MRRATSCGQVMAVMPRQRARIFWRARRRAGTRWRAEESVRHVRKTLGGIGAPGTVWVATAIAFRDGCGAAILARASLAVVVSGRRSGDHTGPWLGDGSMLWTTSFAADRQGMLREAER